MTSPEGFMMSSAAGVQTVAAAPKTQASSPVVDLQTIAHELRQPLSAIESIAYYLSLALPRDSRPARKQARRLQQLVEQSNWILTCALQLADDAPLAPQPLNLEELIAQTVNARTVQGEPGIQLGLAGGLPLVHLDPGRGRAVLENLLTLFRQLASDVYPIRVTTARAEEGVSLGIASAIPDYRSEASLGPGCTLSIQSARRIVEAHGGTLNIQVDAVSGVSLKVVLP
jgi:signal transduction histidine kinase